MLCFVDVEFLTDCQIVVINGCRNKFPSFIQYALAAMFSNTFFGVFM